MKVEITLSNKRTKDIKIINSKLEEKIQSIYPVIQQEKLIVELDDILKKSNVDGSLSFSVSTQGGDATSKVSNITTTSSKALPDLQAIMKQYNAITNTKAVDTTNIKGAKQYMQSNVTFTGSYDGVISFIKNIEGHQKKIMISNLNISGASASI